jgi:hypothetical protein
VWKICSERKILRADLYDRFIMRDTEEEAEK